MRLLSAAQFSETARAHTDAKRASRQAGGAAHSSGSQPSASLGAPGSSQSMISRTRTPAAGAKAGAAVTGQIGQSIILDILEALAVSCPFGLSDVSGELKDTFSSLLSLEGSAAGRLVTVLGTMFQHSTSGLSDRCVLALRKSSFCASSVRRFKPRQAGETDDVYLTYPCASIYSSMCLHLSTLMLKM
jgi:hypothetical protein